MASVEFQYNGTSTVIQCQEGQKMEEIYNNFINKSKINRNEIYYFYDGKGEENFNKQLTFNQIANKLDKERKRMNIIVIDKEKTTENKSKIKSKNIICPECKEDIKMNVKNYKINLFGCKNNHQINNILFTEFENTQIVDLKNIIFELCKVNKSKTYKNQFFKCSDCNINLCLLCKINHNQTHKIYDYDKINIICIKHNELFTNYCKNCKKNICYLCEEEHGKHEVILLRKLMIEKSELMSELEVLKKSINKFKNDIIKLIEILNNVKDNLYKYYDIEEYIFNNYETNERNYEILSNINELIDFNKIIIKDINNENSIEDKFKIINNIYNKINNNEIKLLAEIKNVDTNKNVYFLDNTEGKVPINVTVLEEHYHDFLEELNESNVELYINNKKHSYKKFFKPDKEGTYEIILKFNIMMKDCSYMFFGCSNLTNIDLSSFKTENVTNMGCLCYNCSNLINIDLFSLKTKNVENMEGMFYNCSKLKNINLSSFNTQNVKNLSGMFIGCSGLKNINLSSFNTENVINMKGMFFGCSNLSIINVSSFNTRNVSNMEGMFYGCSKLTYIDLSSFNTINVKNMKGMLYKCPYLKEIKVNKIYGINIKERIDEETTKIIFIEN